jgi:crotonobetainyl-CoA:carnitine CoA-transferase CaiB-like acyl-CoA transferase
MIAETAEVSSTASSPPLAGVRVLDLSRYQAGPKAAMLLADLGAEVIRAENPGTERDGGFAGPTQDGFSIYYAVYNRNKKSIGLNLRSETGRELLRELLPHIDVVIENFRPGYLERLGFSFEAMRSINPRIIVLSISGYGQDGPTAHQTAFCNVALAASGYLAVSGEPFSQVHHTGVSIADRLAGVHGATGVLAALVRRGVTGRGGHVDVSLLDAALSMIEFPLATFLTTGQRPPTDGVARRAGSSPNHIFHTADGLVLINAPKQDQWERLLSLLGRDDLAGDPGLDSPLKRQSTEARIVIEEAVAKWIAPLSVAEACRQLVEADVPAAPVRGIDQVADDEQLKHRHMIVDVTNPTSGASMFVTGNPIKVSDYADTIGRPPNLGEHNAEIYGGLLGLTDERLQTLADDKII